MVKQQCGSSTACLCWPACGFITAEPEPMGRSFSGRFQQVQLPCWLSGLILVIGVFLLTFLPPAVPYCVSPGCQLDPITVVAHVLVLLDLCVPPTMTWCRRLPSACSTALVTDHFLPGLTPFPALLTFTSSESRSVKSSTTFAFGLAVQPCGAE